MYNILSAYSIDDGIGDMYQIIFLFEKDGLYEVSLLTRDIEHEGWQRSSIFRSTEKQEVVANMNKFLTRVKDANDCCSIEEPMDDDMQVVLESLKKRFPSDKCGINFFGFFEVTCVDNIGMVDSFDKGGEYLAEDIMTAIGEQSKLLVEDRFGKRIECFAWRFVRKCREQ